MTCAPTEPVDISQKRKVEAVFVQKGDSAWAELDNNVYSAVKSTHSTLPSGMYETYLNDSHEYVFEKVKLVTDELMTFDDEKEVKLMSDIDNFIQKRSVYEKYGFLHRRGYLLYGPPGTGKTALTEIIISKILNNGGIAVNVKNPSNVAGGLALFRKFEPTRLVVCLFEDIDSIINTFGDSELLSFLDGESQVNHILNIATTNYPETLSSRIKNRPRRFDEALEIGHPSENVRKQYFQKKLSLSEKEAKEWSSKTNTFTFAAMAALVIEVKCIGYSLEDALERIRKVMEQNPHS